tara:strand:- start:4 stop:189 length:186 start_codon:yes stop_codon:yes gene_type:complete
MSKLLSKQVTLKLFFNRSNMSFYIQLNDMLFIVKDKVVAAIQDKEDIDIIHVADIKEMQQT